MDEISFMQKASESFDPSTLENVLESSRPLKSATGYLLGGFGGSYYTPESEQERFAGKFEVSAKKAVDLSVGIGILISTSRLLGAPISEMVSNAAANNTNELLQQSVDAGGLIFTSWGVYGILDNLHRLYMNHKQERRVPGMHFRIAYFINDNKSKIIDFAKDSFETAALSYGFNR